MKLSLRSGLLAAAMLAAFTPAFAQQKTDNTPIETKEQAHARMSTLESEIATLRAQGARSNVIGRLQAEFDALSAWLGGDVPARTGPASIHASSTSGSQLLAGPACGASISSSNFAGTTGPILPVPPPPFVPSTYTAVVSGVGTYLWDLNLNTTILHPNCTDIDMTLTSPSGTVVVISTDNGGANDNVFNGTVWDEQQAGVLNTVVDRVYANNVTSTPLNAEGRMEAFRGEDPNGVWTLTVADDLAANVGSVSAWSLDVSTIPTPSETTTNFTISPAIPIPTGAPTTTTGPTAPAVVAVSGVGTFLSSITVYAEILHTFPGDLDMTLTSPAGTVINLSTDNGGGSDNVFNGTLFSGDAPIAITDAVFVNNTTFPLVGSEGALEAFRGENPNGNWTLNITDDATGDFGTLVRLDVNVTTQAAAPTVTGPTNFAGTTGAINDPAVVVLPVTPTVYTNTVSGVGTVLWDVDLTTVIAHPSGGDIDMTLTSPAGTVVTITTDNGGTNDNVFNGTLWDSNANDGVMDHVYTNNVAATPLTPEGSLTAFRGEDPNGVWTLTITDDATAADFGSLNAWSLDVATIPALPVETLTTVTQSPALAILDVATVSDSMVVSGAGTALSSMTLYVEILHTFPADMDITLTSPGGTVLNITSDNGGGNDNVFNGTTFDWDSTDNVTDHVYANVTVATPLSPETGMDNLLGQDPNGTWTLTITDDLGGDTGTLVRWDLNIKTCPTNGAAFCSNGTVGIDHTTACPCGNVGLPGNGCGHSFDPNGANMSVTGTILADDIVLHSQFEPASSFTLMMQHGNAGDVVFHDGVLCAANPLIRLRGRAAVGGEAFFPNSNFAQDSTTTLSARGGTFPGSGATMRYAAWFRNASTTFCPPATANVTNGWVITW